MFRDVAFAALVSRFESKERRRRSLGFTIEGAGFRGEGLEFTINAVVLAGLAVSQFSARD